MMNFNQLLTFVPLTVCVVSVLLGRVPPGIGLGGRRGLVVEGGLLPQGGVVPQGELVPQGGHQLVHGGVGDGTQRVQHCRGRKEDWFVDVEGFHMY